MSGNERPFVFYRDKHLRIGRVFVFPAFPGGRRWGRVTGVLATYFHVGPLVFGRQYR